MDAIQTHDSIVSNYREYLSSFLSIQDERIKQKVSAALTGDGFLPEPLVQFNPSFAKGRPLQDLDVHADLPLIFGNYDLYQHQIQAIELGLRGQGFIVTSGTGSGKSLTFLATIFNHILQAPQKTKGIKAILVYPMNALINSQKEEIEKFETDFENRTGRKFPVTFGTYTGQEKKDERERIAREEPDIILTNYMMLELIMTRHAEGWFRESIIKNLKYLVFDELHTYRGRQGSDVSMLVRRVKGLASHVVTCIGTSATMVSNGNPIEKKQAVADVAKTIFGVRMPVEGVIGESLEYCTLGRQPLDDELRASIEAGVDIQADVEVFVNHPITNWLETTVALRLNEGVLERGSPMSKTAMALLLAQHVDIKPDSAIAAIQDTLRWTEQLNERQRNAGDRKRYLPFRFHQFISQTGNVSVSLEPRASRVISLEPGRYVKKTDSNDEVVLFPVLFSRVSGFDFLCVEKDTLTRKMKPRNPDEVVERVTQADVKGRTVVEGDFPSGYLILNEEEPFWDEDLASIVPDSWRTGAGSLRSFYQWQMPQRIYFDVKGNYASEPSETLNMTGFYISAKLRIDPTAGIVYEDVKTSEYSKLMRLGNEGRSTATTVLSYATVVALHEQGVPVGDQKLLSFTDNRQDASLQAGHFNDFIATVRLRSAMHFALCDHADGLTVHEVADRLFETLSLKESDYAKQPNEDPDFLNEDNSRAFRLYLLYRLFQDLKRGWRYTVPNLEQTALLKVEYRDLPRLCSMDEKFVGLALLNRMGPSEREDFLIQVLNFFRTNFALDHRILTNERSQTEVLILDKLDRGSLWSLGPDEYLDAPRYMMTSNPGRLPKGLIYGSIGPQSGLGKFIKRCFHENHLGVPDSTDLASFINDLCELLARTNFLSRRSGIRGEKTGNDGITGYLLRTDCIRWKSGDGLTVGVDNVRVVAYRSLDVKPNKFFQRLYMTDFSKFQKQFEGREHTGQLGAEQRIEREKRFRQGSISTLFCSPTMELGIDIANLNVVHMRNVPPNPANYAQRGGRAGRSGQTALVFTYCSSYSAHDQHYFHKSLEMVAGSVIPPKIDLRNEELLLTHFHSFLLMKLGINELKTKIPEVLDFDPKGDLCVRQSILSNVKSQLESSGPVWMNEFRELLGLMEAELFAATWYSESWLQGQMRDFPTSFDRAFDRWRALHRMASGIIGQSRRIMDDHTVKKSSEMYNEAKRSHASGTRQMELLMNVGNQSFGGQSEFYVFRYLASEGFIPGYNFTRLPIRTFVGYKYEERGEYISRPRFIALKEFGPNNIIYHDGSKYRMKRMALTDADSLQRKLRISKATGYAFLDRDAELANNDPITEEELNSDRAEYLTSLMEISESEAEPQQRISCEEEERTSTGYEIESCFNYPKGIDATSRALIKRNGQPLLNLIYGAGTRMIQVNRKWRRADHDGFPIDKKTGRWLRQKDIENSPEDSDSHREVMLFATDWADTLYVQPVSNLELDADQTITLSYALKRALELLFQVEESEMGISIMGDSESPNIMLYEAAQGSLGVLSQLINEPRLLNDLFTMAYRCIHFDPSSREETELGRSLPKASYQDLLSYYNQRHHEVIDRRSIKTALEYLMDCDTSTVQGGKDRDAQYGYLQEYYDKNSSTELKLIQYLFNNGLALPDRTQVNIPEFYINADFVYDRPSGQVLVFCDGSVHDGEEARKADAHKRGLLRNHGYDVVEWHYTETLDNLVQRRKDVFRKVI